MFNLSGKTIVVLGGTGLIGKAVCSALEDQGCNVITVGKQPGNKQRFDCAKVDDEAMKSFLRQTNPDIFINMAYPKEYHGHLDCFLWTTWRVAEWMKGRFLEKQEVEKMTPPRKADPSHEEWRNMRDRAERWHGGAIINFASIYGGAVASDPGRYEGTGMFDPEEWLTYAAVKGGIVALTKELAVRYAKYDVRINCISPGGVSDNQPYEFVERYCNAVPLGRMAKPEDLVGPVVFLASDASRYVTGQNLVVDGGLSCW